MATDLDLIQRIDSLEKELAHFDGWANVLVGLGGKHDKKGKTYYKEYPFLMDEELHNIYLGDGIGTRIIDVVAEDMTREWIDLVPEDSKENDTEQKEAKEIMKVLEDIDAENVYNLALKWKRLYGGSLIVIAGSDGSTLDQPLNISRIKKVEDLNLKVVDRTNVFINTSEFQTNETSPDFGKPIRFDVRFHVQNQFIQKKVHVSRCIVFKGKPVPYNSAQLMTLEHRFWGVSELQTIYEKLQDFGGVSSSITNILYEFIIGKIKIKDLADMISSKEGEGKVIRRLEITNMMKSVLHAIMLDAESEDYSRDTATIAGISDILDRYMMILSGVAGVPVTRLFARQAGGLNNKGEAEEHVYYDDIRSKQKTELKPQLITLIKIIQQIKKNTLVFLVEFNSLVQSTEKEKAEIKKIEAETAAQKANMYKAYIDAGVINPEDAYKEEWEDKLGARDFPEEIPPEDMVGLPPENTGGIPPQESKGIPPKQKTIPDQKSNPRGKK